MSGSEQEHPEPNQADGLGAGVQVKQGGGTQLGPPPVDTPLMHSQGDAQVIGNELENPEPHQADGLGAGVQVEQGGWTQLHPYMSIWKDMMRG